MKKSITKLVLVFSMLFVVSLQTVSVIKAAANISISGVPRTVQPGATFNVNVSIPGYLGGTVTLSGSNCTIISTNPVMIDGSSSFTVKAGGAGPASISASSNDITDQNLNTTNGSGYASFTIASPSSGGSSGGGNTNTPSGGNTNNGGGTATPEKDDRSSDTALKSLSIDNGKLTPEFSANVTEYKVSLASNVSKLTVKAEVNDSKAKVSGIGEKELSVGENKLSVVVTAENGATKEYVIVAIVDDKPEVYLNFNGSKLGVVRNLSGVTPPNGFEETKLTIGGKEVKSWTNNRMKKTVIYLINEKTGEKNFYIYDTKTKKIGSILKPTAILGNNVYIVDIDKEDQKLTGLVYKKIKVDNTELMGWEFEDKALKDYSLIYVMDENGKMQYYQYEKTQNTLQKYSGAAPVTQATYEELSDELSSANTLKLVFMILTGVFAITTIAGVAIILKLRSKIK